MAGGEGRPLEGLPVLGALWPTVVTVLRSFGPDWQALDIEFMNSPWPAAIPALVGAAAIT
jgi:hypothetical protein